MSSRYKGRNQGRKWPKQKAYYKWKKLPSIQQMQF